MRAALSNACLFPTIASSNDIIISLSVPLPLSLYFFKNLLLLIRAVGRRSNGTIIEDPQLFPSGFAFISSKLHSQGMKFGIYTSKVERGRGGQKKTSLQGMSDPFIQGKTTCLGRPGSYGYEDIDAQTYAHTWNVDQVVCNTKQNKIKNKKKMRSNREKRRNRRKK